jgi:hypothetical protein
MLDAASGCVLRAVEVGGPVLDVAYVPDGQHAATLNGNGAIHIVRLQAPQ